MACFKSKTMSLSLSFAFLISILLTDASIVLAQKRTEITSPATKKEQELRFIAILDLSALEGVSSGESQALSDRLRTELFKTGKFKIMEREKMEDVLREQGFQQTGACDTRECAVEIGRLIVVDRMMAGSVGRVGNTYTVSTRIIDVETGSIAESVTRDCACPIDQVLTGTVADLAAELAGIERVVKKKKTWLWATLGIVAAGGTAAAVVASRKGEEPKTIEPESPEPIKQGLPIPPDRPKR